MCSESGLGRGGVYGGNGEAVFAFKSSDRFVMTAALSAAAAYGGGDHGAGKRHVCQLCDLLPGER